MKNQGNFLKEFLTYFTIWSYSENRANQIKNSTIDDSVFFAVLPKTAAIDLVRTLNGFIPNSIRRSSAFYKVLNGERDQMYGWKIVNMLIRSEVREGIQEFEKTNPMKTLYFDDNFLAPYTEGVGERSELDKVP